MCDETCCDNDESRCECGCEDDTFVLAREDFMRLLDVPGAGEILKEMFPDEFQQTVPMELCVWDDENKDGEKLECFCITNKDGEPMVDFVNFVNPESGEVDTLLFHDTADWDVQFSDDGRLVCITAVKPNEESE